MKSALALLGLVGLRSAQALVFKEKTDQEPNKNEIRDGVTHRSNKWQKYTWESEVIQNNKKSISEGMAYKCDPNLACTTNADCGSALCVTIKTKDTSKKYCGCGDFERHFNYGSTQGAKVYESVQVCSCDYATLDSSGTCLPVWRNTIMCKFACKNCFNCEEKGEEACNNDKTCTWNEDTLTCKTTPDAICHTAGDSEENCNHIFCKMGYTSFPGEEKHCMTRAEVLVNEQGANRNCPVGTERIRDSYMGTSGTYFDTCVPLEKAVSNCLFYEWDGESCKSCHDGSRLGTMASNRGDGRLIQNALCVKADDPVNKGCAVFRYHDNGRAADTGEDHHHCERCLDGYTWEFNQDTAERKEGKCVKEDVESVFGLPSATLFFGAGLLGAGALGLAAQRGLLHSLLKGDLKEPETVFEESA